jgi:hypothetical protein
LVGESPSIVEAIKKNSQIAKELELLKMQMTNKIMTQIKKVNKLGGFDIMFLESNDNINVKQCLYDDEINIFQFMFEVQ